MKKVFALAAGLAVSMSVVTPAYSAPRVAVTQETLSNINESTPTERVEDVLQGYVQTSPEGAVWFDIGAARADGASEFT
ncbi:MAG TPA: hypothetical protein H9867_00390 [Candidatus Corynebacterium gallistercoris]|uniref:Uncharacterized protein n=1 Tax=Candidatus Corynebacterium gallistercoris TaxID=2838530 RepID=A0A9D1RVB0_9CORY|nr:hypothetical protein [Candidatus Corynebacterium gallistercoris]